MSCPYFFPVQPLEGGKRPARAPLGAMYTGSCEKGGQGDSEACNFGYPEGRCDVFPVESLADAVRFTTLSGETLYILEKRYAPVRFGDAGSLTGALARQAEVFKAWRPA